MKSYYYMDCLHREIFLEEEDIQAVPESGRADKACSAIAGKPYVVEQFMAELFPDPQRRGQPSVRFPQC